LEGFLVLDTAGKETVTYYQYNLNLSEKKRTYLDDAGGIGLKNENWEMARASTGKT
jgi:hypothetical protein